MKKHVKLWNRITSLTFAGVILGMTTMTVQPPMQVNAAEDVITLRVCNWEEYIDEGGWDEEELIDLDNGMNIIGENSMVEDFEDWYYETYGKIELTEAGENLAKKILAAYDIGYVFSMFIQYKWCRLLIVSIISYAGGFVV